MSESQDQSEKSYDISPLLSEETAVFPGDSAFQRVLSSKIGNHSPYELSEIKTTVHIGAHTDAPRHYKLKGEGMHQRDWRLYLGPCLVILVSPARGERIAVKHLSSLIQKRSLFPKRVLFKTNSFPNPNLWRGDFNSLSPDLIDWLHNRGVRLVGIDTPSIDPASDKILPAHQMVAKHDMAILEGIVLTDVVEGEYVLVALPLKIKNSDASPVRAVLLSKGSFLLGDF